MAVLSIRFALLFALWTVFIEKIWPSMNHSLVAA